MGHPYPLTIIADRYTGAYSKGVFTAWNMYVAEIPEEIDGHDGTCGDFWDKNTIIVGLGSTPNEAVKDLITKLSKSKK